MKTSMRVEWHEDFPTLPERGRAYLVVSRRHIPSGRVSWRWYDDPASLDYGYPGNQNKNVRAFHGWRGTTGDVEITAHGVRRCLAVKEIKFKSHSRISVRWGADRRKNDNRARVYGVR